MRSARAFGCVGRDTAVHGMASLSGVIAAMADEEPVYRLIVRAAVTTGCRIGELIALDWQNVNLTAGNFRDRDLDLFDGSTT